MHAEGSAVFRAVRVDAEHAAFVPQKIQRDIGPVANRERFQIGQGFREREDAFVQRRQYLFVQEFLRIGIESQAGRLERLRTGGVFRKSQSIAQIRQRRKQLHPAVEIVKKPSLFDFVISP